MKGTLKAPVRRGRPVGSFGPKRMAELDVINAKIARKERKEQAAKEALLPLPTLDLTGTKKIGKQAAYDAMIMAGKGIATWATKMDGERTMRFSVLKDQAPSNLGYVKVRDMQLNKVNRKDCIRQINLQTLKALQVKVDGGKVTYRV